MEPPGAVLSYNHGPIRSYSLCLKKKEGGAVKLWLIGIGVIMAFLGCAQNAPSAQGIFPTGRLLPASGKRFQPLRKEGKPGGWEHMAATMQAANAAKSEPLTKQQLQEMITGGVPNQRAIELIRARGIDFEVDDDYVRSLQKAGANATLLAELRKAKVATGGVLVETAPNAQVFLDGSPVGQADAQGVMTLRTKLGVHSLKVSLAGKQDFEQSITVEKGAPTRLVASLTDLAGSVRVKALAGAAVWLDGSNRGTIASTGELLLSNISPGAHALRVTAPAKVDNSQSITVAAGAETGVEVTLADNERVNPQDTLRYVWIAAGDFLMGCSPGDNDCSDPEKPAHKVTLSKAFWIGQTDVTVGAYRHFVEATKGNMPPVSPKTDRGWKKDTFPMVDMVWDEARQYCTWAGGRLPTEAEWEYAARGGIPQARYGDLDSIAWTKNNARNQTHAVATRLANGYGLFDMLGNVWEWVNDWFDPKYYQNGLAQDPSGPASGQERVLRGGAWIVDSSLVRASDRYSIKPDVRSDYFGFRCVWEPKAP
jgi:formylglycine-generating enzyme required for sulfatase activity